MTTTFNGLPGFPCAPVIASQSSSPPETDSAAPGSSYTSKGTFTIPIAAFPLLDMTRSFVLVAVCVIPSRVIRVDEPIPAQRFQRPADRAVAVPRGLDCGRHEQVLPARNMEPPPRSQALPPEQVRSKMRLSAAARQR